MRLPFVDTDYGLTSILALGCALLMLLAMIEWKIMNNHAIETLGGVATDNGGSVNQGEARDADFSLEPQESMSEILERPLFHSSRRPLEDVSEESFNPLANIAASKLTAKLMGVVSLDDGLIALIADRKNIYSRVIEGDYLDGWQVKKIEGNSMLLELGNSTEELKLHKPKLKKPTRNKARGRKQRIQKPDIERQKRTSVNVPKGLPEKQDE